MTIESPPQDELERRVAAADRGEDPPPAAAPGPGGAPLPAPIDEGKVWRDVVIEYGAAARKLLPAHAKPYWTDEALAQLGKKLAACAKHYHWTFADIINHPLFGLGAAAAPLIWPFVEPYLRPLLASSGAPPEKAIEVDTKVKPLEPQPVAPPAAPAAGG